MKRDDFKLKPLWSSWYFSVVSAVLWDIETLHSQYLLWFGRLIKRIKTIIIVLGGYMVNPLAAGAAYIRVFIFY